MIGVSLEILRPTRFKGRIFPVNPKCPEIAGLVTCPSIAALPETRQGVLAVDTLIRV